ncbi:DUF4435 domain-containing protein [Pseudomonas sp. NPDC089534]|uniref:DUF4435 domain-containing protein n=1 Tax=Pseudomonas sp. NPDC089534 TaxID=3364468 RepID=UPI003812778B
MEMKTSWKKKIMTVFSELPVIDKELESMKQARQVSSVLKISILSIRSQLATVPIFVFEGPDDKATYSQWIRRIAPNLVYEPLPANGKDQALKLWDSLIRDKDDLINDIYVFVDRDFDDLKGRETHPNIFMTERYAVENYVVCEKVLDEILKDELHCHAQPEVRASVIAHFAKAYIDFQSVVKDINFIIFCARKLRIDVDSMPKKMSKIASLSLDGMAPADPPCASLLELKRSITTEEAEKLRAEFDQLESPHRMRGKFLLLFFSKWLELLSVERLRQERKLMGSLPKVTKVGASSFSIGSLASRSSLPEGLDSFLARIPGNLKCGPGQVAASIHA